MLRPTLVQLYYLLTWPIHIINSVDKTKFSCNTPWALPKGGGGGGGGPPPPPARTDITSAHDTHVREEPLLRNLSNGHNKLRDVHSQI